MSLEHLEELTRKLGQRPHSEDDLRLPALLEEAPDGIIIIDQEGHFLKANARVVEIFGYSRAELVGRTLEMLLPEEKREVHVREHRPNFFQRPKGRAMGANMEIYGRHKDGRPIALDISITRVESDSGVLGAAYIRERNNAP